MASLVRGIARLVGLADTAAAAAAEEATEEALHAYLRDEDDEQDSDVELSTATTTWAASCRRSEIGRCFPRTSSHSNCPR